MRILLLQKSVTLIEAIKRIIKEFTACNIELKSLTLAKKGEKKIEEKINEFIPDILILDEYYLDGQVEEAAYFFTRYPEMSIAVIISSKQRSDFIRRCSKVGIKNFISKDSAHGFYKEMLIFLDKEYLKREIEKIIIDIVHLKERD